MCVPAIGNVISSIGGLFGGSSNMGQAVATPPAAPPAQAPVAPVAPPVSQAAAQPDQAAVRADTQRRPGAAAGASSTMLTGAGGVDPRLLSIGKTTLLGGA